MSRDALSLSDYLSSIAQAILRIQTYTAEADQETFAKTPLLQDAVIRNLQIVGRACYEVASRYPAFAAANPDVAFVAAYDRLNAMTQGDVNFLNVWDTVKHDLPDLARGVHRTSQQLARARETGEDSPLTMPSRPTMSAFKAVVKDGAGADHDLHAPPARDEAL